MFEVIHSFDCMRCSYSVTVKTKNNAGLETPTLKGGSRTLHNEMDTNSGCYGILRYAGFTVGDVAEGRLKSLTVLRAQVISSAELSETQAKSVATDVWQHLKAHEDVPQISPEPTDLWRKVKDLYRERLVEIEAAKPRSAQDAMYSNVLKPDTDKVGTLAVAYNPVSKEYVTGRSGNQSQQWRQVGRNVVQNTAAPDPVLNPLAAVLSGVQKKFDREVWVCAEVDAAVKALRKGWNLDNVHFYCVEHKGGGWRQIQECRHCLQWAYK